MSPSIAWLEDTTVGAWIPAEQLTEHGVVGSLVPPRFQSSVSVRLTGEDATVVNPWRALREHLVATVSAHTPAPGGCTFGVCDVYGWDGRTTAGSAHLVLGTPANAPEVLRQQAPRATRAPTTSSPPPLLETRIRSYMLYNGVITDADAAARAGGPTEVPDLWWPDDRSWFVATDTDLDFVVVAGPESLTGALARHGVHVESLTPHSRLV